MNWYVFFVFFCFYFTRYTDYGLISLFRFVFWFWDFSARIDKKRNVQGSIVETKRKRTEMGSNGMVSVMVI